MTEEFRTLGTSVSQLAEGPIWVPDLEQVWWVDVFGGVVHRVSWPDGVDDPWDLGERLAFAMPATDGRTLVGFAKRVALLGPGDGESSTLCQDVDGDANTSLNDGKCDSSGRLWFGTLDNDLVNTVASLHSVQAHGGATHQIGDLTISNGLGWSPDGTTMYLIDSGPGNLMSMPFDADSGKIGEASTLVAIGRENILPDGLSVDAAGDIWVVGFGAGRISRYTPAGELAEVRELPISHPTSCCFVGPGLEKLLVTSSAWAVEGTAGPLDGQSLLLDVETPGLPVSFFTA
ncbi:MAG: hypothetical protein JWM76_1587 [Pseudonocardiales bacterium]|nr:hypothetical protein [Pseudonocardiales bacterium]